MKSFFANMPKLNKCIVGFFCILSFMLCFGIIKAETREYDVVIYGGTPAAITAAIQAVQMGKNAVIVSPDRHLGGLTTSGLGFTDSGNTAVIGGLAREFYRRVYRAYQKEAAWAWQKKSEYTSRGQGTKAMLHEDQTMWVFEPHVAEGIFEEWLAEMKIPVVRDAWLDRAKGVVKDGGRIVSIETLCGRKFKGRVFIDATYEGDLMAATGIDYHVGREANRIYEETWNGNQIGVLHHAHWFKKPVAPYAESGVPSSGRLKYIDDSEPGIRGKGDRRIQAYCFRMCLTDHPANRIPFPKPEGYSADDYKLLLRVFEGGWRETFRKFDKIPNHKTDTNNHGPFSTDFVGMNYDYPEASYERRKEMVEEHVRYQQGLMYFMANDPRVPSDVRNEMSRWGLAKDEFTDNGHWPHLLYIREARRMIGEYVVTEHDCLGKRRCPKPVGMGSYHLDSHNVRRYVTAEGFVQNEGDIGVRLPGPYTVDFGALVPKQAQCGNLVVPVCVSSSHIAFGSVRMEPVFMILGQSAGTIASRAIDEKVDVQRVDYVLLRERLLTDGQCLEMSAQRGGK